MKPAMLNWQHYALLAAVIAVIWVVGAACDWQIGCGR